MSAKKLCGWIAKGMLAALIGLLVWIIIDLAIKDRFFLSVLTFFGGGFGYFVLMLWLLEKSEE